MTSCPMVMESRGQSLYGVHDLPGRCDLPVSLPSVGLHFSRGLMIVGLMYRWTSWILQCDNVSVAE